jgi:hypothetical protein
MDMERVDLKKLMRAKLNNSIMFTNKNKFAAVEDMQRNGDINWAWDTIRENINISNKESIGHCESKHHKTFCEERCSDWSIEGSRLNYSGYVNQVSE